MTAPEWPADMIERVSDAVYYAECFSDCPNKGPFMYDSVEYACKHCVARAALAAAFPDGLPRPEAEVKAEAHRRGSEAVAARVRRLICDEYGVITTAVSIDALQDAIAYRADVIEGAEQ